MAGVLLLASFSTYAVESHPGLDVESMYSEAVLAYNKKQTGEAIKILEQLLTASPRHLEGLELMALTLKTQGNDAKALAVYSRLLKLKPVKERGPYHFETGIILHKQNKAELAAPHFQQAIRLKFNTIPSHLFLGLIHFNAGNTNAAEREFSEVKAATDPELKIIARYYLGLIHFKNGYGAGGTDELIAARALAADAPSSKMAADISAAADKILTPFNTSQWFGNFTALTQYDSNIILASSPSTPASNKSTPNLVLNGGFGRMSSPVSDLQWVGSYRLAFNYALNTKDYSFFTNLPSLYLNFRPLARFNGGIKTEGSYTFKYRPETPGATAGAYIFGKYAAGIEAGPFLRYDANQHLQLQLDTSMRRTVNYDDSGLTGNTLVARFSLKSTSPWKFLNPAGTVSYESNAAQGPDSRYSSVGIGASNSVRLTSADTATLSMDLLLSRYPLHSLQRADSNIASRLSWVRAFGPKWMILADFSYTKNISSIDETYSFNRIMTSAGLGWSL